jgi:CheY-like chemotaxis protein
MASEILPGRVRLRLVVLNDSAPVLNMICGWFERHGHHCATALIAEMPRAHEEVGQFILRHLPDVVIYDVGMPHLSSWDLLEVIRASPTFLAQPFVITTSNKRILEQAVGPTSAIEIGERDEDLLDLLQAVEAAADRRRG